MNSKPRLCASLLIAFFAFILYAGVFPRPGSGVMAAALAPQETPTATPSPSATPSASPSPTPDPKLEELDRRITELDKRAQIIQKEKDIATNEALISTAEKDKIQNLLPQPTATPLAGTVNVTGTVAFQGELLAYKSLADIADAVGTDIHDFQGTVIIHNDSDIKALQTYAIILSQIKNFVSEYEFLNGKLNVKSAEEVGPAGILAAPEVASTLLRSVADVAALFRTNTDISGLAIIPDETVINATIASALRQHNMHVFEPKLYLPNLIKGPDSELIKQLGVLTQMKALAEQSAADYDALPDNKKTANQKIVIPKLKALNAQVDTFINNLTHVDDTTKESPLLGLYRAERLKILLQDTSQQCYVLYIKLAKAEGTRTVKSNLFTGTKISYTGGMILSYTLFDRDGEIKKAGIFASYRGSSNNKPQENVLLRLP
jgi:hypothetical protein